MTRRHSLYDRRERSSTSFIKFLKTKACNVIISHTVELFSYDCSLKYVISFCMNSIVEQYNIHHCKCGHVFLWTSRYFDNFWHTDGTL